MIQLQYRSNPDKMSYIMQIILLPPDSTSWLTDQESIFPERSRSTSGNRVSVRRSVKGQSLSSAAVLQPQFQALFFSQKKSGCSRKAVSTSTRLITTRTSRQVVIVAPFNSLLQWPYSCIQWTIVRVALLFLFSPLQSTVATLLLYSVVYRSPTTVLQSVQ